MPASLSLQMLSTSRPAPTCHLPNVNMPTPTPAAPCCSPAPPRTTARLPSPLPHCATRPPPPLQVDEEVEKFLEAQILTIDDNKWGNKLSQVGGMGSGIGSLGWAGGGRAGTGMLAAAPLFIVAWPHPCPCPALPGDLPAQTQLAFVGP